MFHEPRSKIHWALRVASPFACGAPPRRKECELEIGVGFVLVCASLADNAVDVFDYLHVIFVTFALLRAWLA
ncbi:hypothetical protein PHMEG_00015543 [Phytophthora megakarya]|uniref:Uncharacterized protein n=1 Tax=Phytophthora megakarya TaxID=4795 RepID=A0A225W2J0_9STRA|nr:hypothetical protein PHMEG_00015543 [Phytophthora megakarya]